MDETAEVGGASTAEAYYFGSWRRAGGLADIGSEAWLRERFPDKDWHRHPRTDGRADLCDGTPSDCRSKVRLDENVAAPTKEGDRG